MLIKQKLVRFGEFTSKGVGFTRSFTDEENELNANEKNTVGETCSFVCFSDVGMV